MLNKITVENTSIKYIQDVLDDYGVVRIENFIDKTTLECLIEEFNNVQRDDYYKSCSIDYSIGSLHRIKKGTSEYNRLPCTKKVFSSSFMENISAAYFKNEFSLNHEIFFCKDIKGSSHGSQKLHYDRIPTLKYFIYLNNVNKNNGAFHCVPGSHILTRKIEVSNRKSGIMPTVADTRAHTEDNLDNEVSVNGEAGTLIVVHTDTVHRAYPICSGERLLMRGHTRLQKDWNLANGKTKLSLYRNMINRLSQITSASR